MLVIFTHDFFTAGSFKTEENLEEMFEINTNSLRRRISVPFCRGNGGKTWREGKLSFKWGLERQKGSVGS